MREIARRAALVVAAVTAVVGLGAVAAPAQALDTGWGCGGACRVVGR